MNHFQRENFHYIQGLRTSKGGITKEMLAKLQVPTNPPKGWIKKLSLAPFPLRTASPEEIASLWCKSELPESVSRKYEIRKPEVIPVTVTDDRRTPRITVTVHFDGGTPCNVPARGYGIGYGSYRFDSGPVVRVDHKRPMSANAAEIWTLCSALETLLETYGVTAPLVKLLIQGDSQIALKWAAKSRGNSYPSQKSGSGEFVEAGKRLCELTPKFSSLKTEWKARIHAVKAFGH